MRWVWPLLVLAIGIVTGMAQLDRQARRSPEFANYVPDALRGFSQYHATASLLAEGDNAAGLQAAARLVARRPMPEENLRLYAQAALLVRDQMQASFAFQQAAHRGWRDPIAQEVQLRLALAAGDGAEAGRRLAAIWAISPDKDKLGDLAELVLTDPNGRASFTQVLADSSRLNRRFLALGPAILPREVFEEVQRDTAHRSARLN